jgi:translation initiation factor 3 subunit B
MLHVMIIGADTVMDFSWEPRGERFAIVSSNDPNLGNPGPGVTVKTEVSCYQLDRGKNDFKLLRQSALLCSPPHR